MCVCNKKCTIGAQEERSCWLCSLPLCDKVCIVMSSSAFPGTVLEPKYVHNLDIKCTGAGLISGALGFVDVYDGHG